MPYIKQKRREEIISGETIPQNAGELNYLLTEMILTYFEDHGESYQIYNDMIGVLECMKHELYRRMVSDYEDCKKEENGDVF